MGPVPPQTHSAPAAKMNCAKLWNSSNLIIQVDTSSSSRVQSIYWVVNCLFKWYLRAAVVQMTVKCKRGWDLLCHFPASSVFAFSTFSSLFVFWSQPYCFDLTVLVATHRLWLFSAEKKLRYATCQHQKADRQSQWQADLHSRKFSTSRVVRDQTELKGQWISDFHWQTRQKQGYKLLCLC